MEAPFRVKNDIFIQEFSEKSTLFPQQCLKILLELLERKLGLMIELLKRFLFEFCKRILLHRIGPVWAQMSPS